MPQLRAGEWQYSQSEVMPYQADITTRAEDKPGHKPVKEYKLPKWVWHPAAPERKLIVEKSAYEGMASAGHRNVDLWNIAHVAAYHDDLKLLSLATPEECREPNKWGNTPAHMCGMGQHPYGASLCVLYELVQMGAADVEQFNFQHQTPWHIAQRMQKPGTMKAYEKVLLKGGKPPMYEEKKEAQLRKRGKFARTTNVDPLMPIGDGPSSLPVCLVFPGQGAQMVGMLKTLKDLPPVKAMLEKANDILGYDLLELCLNGPEEKLVETQYCQPAIYVASLAALEQLKQDDPEKVDKAMAVAGLSLGEYTALTVAGVWDFETGLEVVKCRAEAMDYEVTKPDSPAQAMISIAGLPEETVEQLCKDQATGGTICQIANYLFPKGFSVAGDKKAITALETTANEAGALQAKLVKTGGAFHTAFMQGAKDAILEKLAEVEEKMSKPRRQVYMNVTAQPIGPSTPVHEIIRLLGEQLVSPVKWEQSMNQAIADGLEEFYECGPNKQLKAMMKRINPKVHDKTYNVSA